jgi:glycerol-3-phosphate dehydrogenase
VLSVFGGKITTYRRLAEQALDRLAPYFPQMKQGWTAAAALPGSDFRLATPAQALAQLGVRYANVPPETLRGVFSRHGALAAEVLGDGALGEHYGAGLHEREVSYFIEREWAVSTEDVLWRRTKAGLQMTQAQRERVAARLGK